MTLLNCQLCRIQGFEFQSNLTGLTVFIFHETGTSAVEAPLLDKPRGGGGAVTLDFK